MLVKCYREMPVRADCVMPMPDSGRSAAAGYARASGIPYREGIVPNRYVGRTFIKPTQDQRVSAVRLKLNVVGDLVRDRKLVIVDDSIVRGTTTKAKMEQIRRQVPRKFTCAFPVHQFDIRVSSGLTLPRETN